MNKKLIKKIIAAGIIIGLIPLLIALYLALYKNGSYALLTFFVAILSLLPFFVVFEVGKNTAREIVIVAVMTAISVVARLIFAPIPGFKPVTAIIIITGIAFGAEVGFISGSMTALISNIYFGQGLWTPFQMFAWGIIGFIAGALCQVRRDKILVPTLILGLVGGAMFSLSMDVYTVLSTSGEFVIGEYALLVVSSLPFMALYALSNAVFLLILTKPLLEKLDRIKVKYGVFDYNNKKIAKN